MKHLFLAAAAFSSACLSNAAQAAEAPEYAVRISFADIDFGSASGERRFARRAHAASLQACGLSLGRGTVDDASNRSCRTEFVTAARAKARRAEPQLAAD